MKGINATLTLIFTVDRQQITIRFIRFYHNYFIKFIKIIVCTDTNRQTVLCILFNSIIINSTCCESLLLTLNDNICHNIGEN